MQFNQLFANYEPCDSETAEALDLCPLGHDARALDDAGMIGEALDCFALAVDMID